MPVLNLLFDSGESSLSVIRFSVHEAISTPFTVTVSARSEDPAIDIGAIVGRPAGLRVISGYAWVANGGSRLWTGICNYMEQVQAETPASGPVLATYFLRIVPSVWLLTQRRTHRIYQHLSIPDIADKLLGEWGIKPAWKIDRGRYPKLEYKVQYGETDFAFMSRLLEEAGIAYTFPDDDQGGSKITFGDALQSGEGRGGAPLHYVDNPSESAEKELVTRVRLVHDVRPGAHTIRDYDFRNPAFALFGEAPKAGPEAHYEQYDYRPGGFLIEKGGGGGTPVADDKGAARYDQAYGADRAARALASERAGKAGVAFDTNTIDLWPGVIFAMENHSHAELNQGKKLLVTDFSIEGTPEAEWMMSAQAVFADVPYRPPITTPRPHVRGVQSATIVGPAGQEIHTDEFGRVRVQFPWDREGKSDDGSSCWIRVSQGWGGKSYGFLNLPRIGQEVLIAYLEGDPEQPVVVGRLYNATHPVPYKLPDYKTVSTWKSDSSLGSMGYNEVKLEDKKGDELLYEQAEKNLRKLVKNDETITVLNNRDKTVIADELETVGVNRIEVTGLNRNEMTGGNRVTFVGQNKHQLIRENESEVTEGNRQLLVLKDQDIVTKGKKRELNEWDTHQTVVGNRNEKIDKTQSLTVLENQYEKVGGNHALSAGKDVHLAAKVTVGEGGGEVTVKGAGGFIRMHSGGITIEGTMVYINDRGSPADGRGSKPKDPEPAKPANVRVGRHWDAGAVKDHAASDELKTMLGKALDPDALDPLKALGLQGIVRLSDFSMPANGSVLWSGGLGSIGEAAKQLAGEHTKLGIPSFTPEMTPGGIELGEAASGANWSTQSGALSTLSDKMTQQASGAVNLVVFPPIAPDATVREDALALAGNKKVTSINFRVVQDGADGAPYKAPHDNSFVLFPMSPDDVLKPPGKAA